LVAREAEATVAEYLDMLDQELRGVSCVPRKTQAPLTVSGVRSTAGPAFQSSLAKG
jgi:hypothetical protein